jgi:hypothetical protein
MVHVDDPLAYRALQVEEVEGGQQRLVTTMNAVCAA